MCINQFTKAFCACGTENESIHITIYMHGDNERCLPLYSGEAKDLINHNYLADFIVVEILIDRDPKFDHLPDYKKGRIITVV